MDGQNSYWVPFNLLREFNTYPVHVGELLVEFIVCWGYKPRAITYSPHVIISLQDAKEWDKLKCWICIIWIMWLEDSETKEEDLEHVMLSLFHQQPAALQKPEERMC